MLTSHVVDYDMNVPIHVQILLGYLQPVHLGNQSHLILGLDHHQSSPRFPLSHMCTLTKTKQGCLSFRNSLCTSQLLDYSKHETWCIPKQSHDL